MTPSGYDRPKRKRSDTQNTNHSASPRIKSSVTTCSCASVLDFAASARHSQFLTRARNPFGLFSVPPASAPELAARGRYPVGVRTIEIVHRDQVDILHF